MIKQIITTGLFIILTFTGLCQSKLTPEEIREKNYQEFILPDGKPFFNFMDKQPMYPGGFEGFYEHLQKNTIYPESAREKNIEGVVLINFCVDIDGTIIEIEVAKSVDPELDAEAIRVLKTMDLWVPGYQMGSPVRAYFSMPFRFILQDDENENNESDSYQLMNFYDSFSFDPSFQLERIQFPLTIQNNEEIRSIDKADWVYDSLFANLSYLTQIYTPEEEHQNDSNKLGNDATFSWIYPDKQEKKDYHFQKIDGEWYLSKIAIHSMKWNDEEDFIPFLKKFMSDSLFQFSRVQFPLECEAYSEPQLDGDNWVMPDTILLLNRSDWNFGTLYDGLEFLIQFSHSASSEIPQTDDIILEVTGIETGLFMKYFFKRINNQWYLIKFLNKSM